MPDLPNFLTGGIINDDSPEFSFGRARFEEQAIRCAVITPIGVNRPGSYWDDYKQSFNHFGRNDRLRCPYYLHEQGGLCGIWRYRNSKCSTWFCKYESRSYGVIFWKYIEKLLFVIERTLSQWCILQLNPEALPAIIPCSGEITPNHPALWGNYKGREREFFIDCWNRVSALSWEDVRSICGVEAETLSFLVIKSYEAMLAPHQPLNLKAGPYTSEYIGNNTYRVWAYSKFDPLDIPASIFNMLPYFDGRPVELALKAMKNDRGFIFDTSWIPILTQSLILIPAN
jgi:hypothetical protein